MLATSEENDVNADNINDTANTNTNTSNAVVVYNYNDNNSDANENAENDKLELEYSTNVSSTIMMKVPTACLVTLRNCFENEPQGLNLVQFLKAFVTNMDLENHEMLLKTVPDLVDLFCLVDVNG
jgi:hypothetical protein